MPWYYFTPNSPLRNVGDSSNYTRISNVPPATGLPTACLNPPNFSCAIQAMDNSGLPVITNALVLEIANALENRTNSTNVTLNVSPAP